MTAVIFSTEAFTSIIIRTTLKRIVSLKPYDFHAIYL